MSRRQAREKALQTLYQVDIGGMEAGSALQNTIEEFTVRDEDRPFLEDLIFGTLRELPLIDEIIKGITLTWNLERMASVDRNILRIALYEIYFRDDIPINVSLNEAIEMAKVFGDEDSGKFVNGILGKVAANPEQYQPVKGTKV